MSRPTKGYLNAEGQRLPGVTTVLGIFGDKGGIIHAANKLGLEGKNIRDVWYTAAANTGTLAHDLFEAEIHRRLDRAPISVDLSPYTEPEIEKAQRAFEAACEWFDQTRLDIIWTEKPLVSERLQMGGTPDALARDTRGRIVVPDWKSGGVFGSALFQVASYKLLVEENFPDITVEGFHIVRFGKDTGDFVHRYYPNLDEQVEAIPRMRQLYDLIKATDKRAA